ncbi:MAG: M23 family metallopeptidase [Butyrivibrio sp.]|nr:M23 family metallopeptidase [Butyrivibrio sp.]
MGTENKHKKHKTYGTHRKHRHKRNYTFMIISGDSDGTTKRLHLNHSQTQMLAYCLFAVALALCCFILYSIITIGNLSRISKEQKEQIAALEEENSSLAATNDNLASKTEMMEDTLQAKLDNEERSAEEAAELAKPTGFPLTGTAPLPQQAVDDPNSTEITKITDKNKDTAKGNPLVLFTAVPGSNVIASGAGTVMTVTTDVKFGNIVAIDHGNGMISMYRNSGKPLVSEGDKVDRGTILYVVGDKNKTLGYQIQENEVYINPEEKIEIVG